MKKLLIALLISGLVLGGAGVVVYAQTNQSPICPPENNITELLGMTPSEIRDAHRNGKTLKDLFDAQGLDYDAYISEMTENSLACVVDALANGDITEEQATRMKDAIQKSADNGIPFNMKIRIFKNFKVNKLKIGSLNNLASVMGMETADLIKAFKTGSTFGQIAQQQGIDPGTAFEEWINTQIANINQAVEDGNLDSSRAAAAIEKLNDKLAGGFDFENWTPFGKLPGPRAKVAFLAGKDLFGSVLDAFGMTQEEFRSALQDGQTLEELSVEKGVDLDALYQTWIADQINAVNEKLSNEEISQQQADALLERLNNQLGQSFPTDFLRRLHRGVQNFRENRSRGFNRFGGLMGRGDLGRPNVPAESNPGASF